MLKFRFSPSNYDPYSHDHCLCIKKKTKWRQLLSKQWLLILGYLSNYIWRQHPFVSSVILAIPEAEYLTSLETKVLPEMVKHRRFEKNGYFNLRSIKQWRIRPIFPVQETRRRTKFQAFQYRWTDMISL